MNNKRNRKLPSRIKCNRMRHNKCSVISFEKHNLFEPDIWSYTEKLALERVKDRKMFFRVGDA